MMRFLAAALVLLLVPAAAAQARAGDPDRAFGRRGTVTLKATAADAVAGAVKVISGNRVLAGGSAAGQFVVVRLRKTGTLDSKFGTGGQVVPGAARHDAGRRARAGDLPRRADRRRRDAAARRRHDAHGRRSGCCRRARSTRASARASATCWPARPTRSSAR